MAPYIAKVEAHLKASSSRDFEATFHTTTPPATTTHAITEFRIARNLIRNAVEAEKQGYAAMAITHFQDAGLAEVKSVVGHSGARAGRDHAVPRLHPRPQARAGHHQPGLHSLARRPGDPLRPAAARGRRARGECHGQGLHRRLCQPGGFREAQTAVGARMPRAARRRRRRHRAGRRPADDAVLRRDRRRAGGQRRHADREERGDGDQAAQARHGARSAGARTSSSRRKRR